MILRYHEAPLCLFDEIQKVTDGDYALVHLFETNEAYLEKFQQAVANGRKVILDNSIFELGTAFNPDRFAHWVKKLRPTWYVVPDSWKNSSETVRMFREFIRVYPRLPGKRVGVAQGNTVEEVIHTYQAIEPYCDMVAFNFDFSSVFYDEFWNVITSYVPKRVAMSLGRFMVLSELEQSGVINHAKKHHLLGCGVPQEVQWYNPEWSWLFSIDTCNPVTAGLEGWAYDAFGTDKKSPIKICDIVDYQMPELAAMLKLDSRKLRTLIFANIELMKGWCEQ